MHEWGDEWFKQNGSDLNDAINYCIKFWKKYARIGSHGKEKWGIFEDYTYFWDGRIHTLLYPGCVWIKYRWLYFVFDKKITIPFVLYTGIYKLVLSWQRFIYNYAIQRMCKKYPNIVDELVMDLSRYEYIKPSIFGKVDGTKIHNKYWRTI